MAAKKKVPVVAVTTREGRLELPTNITAEITEDFEALRNPKYTNFALFSCFRDGRPAVAIVAVTRKGSITELTPLFLAIDREMAAVLTDHDGEPLAPRGSARIH